MSKTTKIAAVRIAGGETAPFYSAKLRVFYWDTGTHSGTVVKDVAGLRVLLADADAKPVENGGTHQVHLPLMVRGYVRPQKHTGLMQNHGLELRLESNATAVTGTLIEAKSANDIMLVPIAGWPQALGYGIDIPALRFAAGAIPVKLAVNQEPLIKFLKLVTRSGKSTLFGGLLLAMPATKTLELTLVPNGIELDGSLPDPTRDLLDPQDPHARITGRFRLERCHVQGKPSYRLRLVGGPPGAMEQLEARIARAFADLGNEKNAPLAVRFDRRPSVPPLLWPMEITDKGLALITTAGGDFEMAIEQSAIDARVRTISRFPGDLPGIAAIHGEYLAWRKQANGFDVVIAAGRDTAGAPKVEIELAREEIGNTKAVEWTARLKESFKEQLITVPLDAMAARLLAAYKSGRVVAAAETQPPYAFLPLVDGWLQLGLIRPRKELAESPKPGTAPSAMSGRIVAAHGASADGLRGIVVDAAARLSLIMKWRMQNAKCLPAGGMLDIAGARGQLRGFVFVAEIAPTAAEALPDLRRGPAATRDLPIAFNAPQSGLMLKGFFTWKPTEWSLRVSELVEVVPPDTDPVQMQSGDGKPGGYGWKVPHDRPFITNHPLTRTAVTPTEPSVSRGLLRYAFEGEFTLAQNPDGGEAPTLTVHNPPASWSDESHAPATATFVPDTLVLTTLPGPEFTPQEWPKKQGQFKAALRHDLAILDELYAWSDPPPPKAGSAPPSAVSEREAVIVTALDPKGLEEVWEQNRARIALTRTQDAFMTGWVETGASHAADITSLVQPYTWNDVHLKIDLAPRWGAYELADKTYALETALAGLRHAFDVAGTELKSGTAIIVRGNAASLFKRDGSDLVWDSRGTGLAPAAANGARPVGLNGALRGELRTLHKAQSIEIDATLFPWMTGTRLAFYVRDLPVEKGVFDGAANPVESAPGTVGQAFDRANFASSLHEWRLLENPTLAAPADGAPRTPKPFDLCFGPFLFTPSRLLRVELDGAGEVNKIAVVGGLRIARRIAEDASSGAEHGPFGADRIYQRADLFCLTLTRNGATWRPAWTGVKLQRDGTTLKFLDRDPEIRCTVPLAVEAGGILSAQDAPVDATIALDIASRLVRLGARLFGRACELETEAAIGEEISFEFNPAGSAAAASIVLLSLDKIAVKLRSDRQSIRIDGALFVMPDTASAADEATALARFGRDAASFRWLDLSAGKEKAFGLSIDHASGQVSAEWDGAWTQARPLFGLEAGAWSVRAKLEAFFASPEPLHALAPLAASAAWARLTGCERDARNRIDHRLLVDADGTEHYLDLSWDARFTSPVLWPVNGLRQLDGSALPPEWLEPSAADSRKAGRSRKIRIEAGDTLTHTVKARLRRHRIEAAQLQRVAKHIAPRTPILLLVEVEHELARDQTRVTFTTLDHVAITSLRLMTEAAKDYAFASRYRHLRYRGQNTQAKVPHAGIVQLPWAVSGFFDEALIRWYGGDAFEQHRDTPLLLGGAAILFPYRVAAEQRAVAAVIPWLGLDGAVGSEFKQLSQAGGEWEVAAPDLWGGSPYVGPLSQRTVVVPADADAAQVLSGITDADLTPGKEAASLARVIPVEQLFFENLRKDSGGQIEIGSDSKNDIATAPFFLRALLAIQSRWNATVSTSTDPLPWRALSLHPARGKTAGAKADPVVIAEVKRMPAQVRDKRVQVPADLIALSARRAERQSSYRLIQADLADDAGDQKPRAELVARARDLDRFAECAIREVDRDGDMPAIAIVTIPTPRVVPGGRGRIEIEHPVLAPSPALGWPSVELTEGLDKLAPRLGSELPVQSKVAGLAARFRQIGLPGHSPNAMTYFAFSHRVAFERDLTVPFDGPAARHLSPVNTRLRAPTDKALEARDDAARATTPFLPPFFELATIGRRPGVFEVVTAAVTVAAEADPLDPQHDRFGRPANSGPLVAHQLRTPRSPALPDDTADLTAAQELGCDVLKLRRRTFLSLADRTDADPESAFVLDTFRAFGASADVLRHEAEGKHLRVALELESEKPDGSSTPKGKRASAAALIGPDWDGLLAVKIDAAATGFVDPKIELERVLSPRRARLEVGAASFELQDEKPFNVDWPSWTWVLSAKGLLQDAREELRRATADLPIRLVITFGADGPLPPAPLPKAILPLALDPGDRRVLKTRARTIAFGDPSYDRQLGSTTEGHIKQIGSARALLSVDRQEYDPGAPLYFACGTIDQASGLFTPASSSLTIRFRRLGRPNPDGSVRAPEKLAIAGRPPDVDDNGDNGYSLEPGTPHEVSLRLLRHLGAGTTDVSPLEPGDRLEISADLTEAGETKTLTVFVNIVATPVIAPPPCVYSVIESTSDAKPISRVVLHAAAPLPQHIELPDLRDGLAQGYVNRRALFVWRFARLGTDEREIELVKYDRSGGAQLPPA